MNKRKEIFDQLNILGYEIDNDMNILINEHNIPFKQIIDSFLEGGQFESLNFDVNHIVNEIVIKSIEMYNEKD